MPKVSEILLKARRAQGLSLEKVSLDLKIQVKFIRAIEEGNFKIFSSGYQITGFLKNYARYLGLPAEEVLAFYRRDFGQEVLSSKNIQGVVAKSPWLTPERITFAGGLLVLFIFVFYLFLQYRAFFRPPPLTLESPTRDLQVKGLQIEIKGHTCTDCQLDINGQRVNVLSDGTFLTNVSLRSGTNQLTVVATSRAGRQTAVTRNIVVEP